MVENLLSLWRLLRKDKLSIEEVEALVPVIHQYALISLPLLDIILVRLYSVYQAAEDKNRIHRLVIALQNNVTRPI